MNKLWKSKVYKVVATMIHIIFPTVTSLPIRSTRFLVFPSNIRNLQGVLFVCNHYYICHVLFVAYHGMPSPSCIALSSAARTPSHMACLSTAFDSHTERPHQSVAVVLQHDATLAIGVGQDNVQCNALYSSLSTEQNNTK